MAGATVIIYDLQYYGICMSVAWHISDCMNMKSSEHVAECMTNTAQKSHYPPGNHHTTRF